MKHAHNARYNSPELIGKRFGSLTVVGFTPCQTSKGKQWLWICRCDCGTEKRMVPGNVIIGHTKTCGCGKRRKKLVKRDEAQVRLRKIWRAMIERCECDYEKYKRYYGRGINVCDEWHDYRRFSSWAYENGYAAGLSIERIDNDGNYCPENCKWINRSLQARNRCTTLWVEYKGNRMSLAEACEMANMPYKQVFSRIKYLGWPVEKALEKPMRPLSR